MWMIELNQTKLPRFPTENGKSAETMLEELCWQGLARDILSKMMKSRTTSV